jgi:hypothetical protein
MYLFLGAFCPPNCPPNCLRNSNFRLSGGWVSGTKKPPKKSGFYHHFREARKMALLLVLCGFWGILKPF